MPGERCTLCRRELENPRQPCKTRFFIKEGGASLLRERAARCAQSTPPRALSMEGDCVLRAKASSGLIASISSPFPRGKSTPALRNGAGWGKGGVFQGKGRETITPRNCKITRPPSSAAPSSPRRTALHIWRVTSACHSSTLAHLEHPASHKLHKY